MQMYESAIAALECDFRCVVHSLMRADCDTVQGTSPLYTFAGIFADPSLKPTPENFVGAPHECFDGARADHF